MCPGPDVIVLIFSPFLQRFSGLLTLQYLSDSPIQTHSYLVHREQFGVHYLAQGDLDMQLGGAGIQTSDLLITRRPAIPPELQLHLHKL